MEVCCKTSPQNAIDFVETPLSDVMRTLSLAYNTSILVDDDFTEKVTFHLDGMDLLAGLDAICSAYHLEMYQENGVVHIRRAVDRGIHEFSKADSLISVSVRNKDVREFVREYALNTGMNILVEPSVTGTVSGDLRNLGAKEAFTALMGNAGYKVLSKGHTLIVQNKMERTDKVTEKKFRLERTDSLYAVDAHDVPLKTFLQELSNVADLDLAVYGDIRDNVQARFEGVDLSTLLEALFKGNHYSYSLHSSKLFVSEGGAKKALSKTRLFPLRFIHSEKALAYLGKFSPNPEFVAVEIKEQNGLLLSGSESEIRTAEEMLEQIDVPAMQVTLSCIIVEFKRGKNFEIGVRGGSGRKTGEYNVGAKGYFDFLEKDFSVAGAFGKIGLLPDRFELELASMEEQNKAQVLARPRLTTINGNKAELNVTNTVYYLVSQVSADGYPITDYRSFNDGISLEITPVITGEGVITLEVSPEIKTAGRSSGDGPRDISTRNLKTVVTLKNGESLCLGGLIRKNKSEVRTAVPFFGSIPFIGRLFSYTSEEEEENELAIFITPILEK
ncbi:MAG: type II and III secretion system protein [Fibrobacter sp.]|nr:type II and III secretion system protein [Fibrobacter sp.]